MRAANTYRAGGARRGGGLLALRTGYVPYGSPHSFAQESARRLRQMEARNGR